METTILGNYLPLIVGVIVATLMTVARLLTNALLSRRHEAILLAGSTLGVVPGWISALYLLGQVSLLITFFWSFRIRWWAPSVIAALYLLLNLIQSRAPKITRELKDGPYKKCAKCGTVRNVSYFAIDRSTSDQTSPFCVACSDPETWAMVQRFKEL
jgi:hypothetical protein